MADKTPLYYCATATNGDPLFRLSWAVGDLKDGRMTGTATVVSETTPSEGSLYQISEFYEDGSWAFTGYYEIDDVGPLYNGPVRVGGTFRRQWPIPKPKR